ncbi:MAG: ATP-binding protein [Chlamydiia bacterium]|nr:ATP-binding protein [Chlamydiia bacterium]
MSDMWKKRYLTEAVLEDLEHKMVFLSGPRQVGKTTLSRELIGEHYPHAAYCNWDFKDDRKKILSGSWDASANLVIFDEIHKYRRWKNLIKGYYDKWKERFKFLVTGSARLNVFRRGGDSLQGRYHSFRLHPFSLTECFGLRIEQKPFHDLLFSEIPPSHEDLNLLVHYGGFPEPLIRQNERHLRRWHKEKIERLFQEDVRDLETIRDLSLMEVLSDLLPNRVGSLLSLNSLREDLEISHRSITHWMNVLEKLYYHYRIYPYVSQKIRSLKKEPKLFLWDWSEVIDEGARWENCIGSHLRKFVHYLQDYQGYQAELYFLRDRDKREIDFLVTINQKPWFACEVKLTNHNLSTHLNYFAERINIPFTYQVTLEEGVDHFSGNTRIISGNKFLSAFN